VRLRCSVEGSDQPAPVSGSGVCLLFEGVDGLAAVVGVGAPRHRLLRHVSQSLNLGRSVVKQLPDLWLPDDLAPKAVANVMLPRKKTRPRPTRRQAVVGLRYVSGLATTPFAVR
jgi:hypothetical protein